MPAAGAAVSRPQAPAGRRSETDPTIGFEPSPAQFKYLLALEEVLEKRQSTSDSAVCRALKMSRQTLWEWKQDPYFRRWLRSGLDRTSDDHWPLILRRHELLAIQGSVRSAEFIARVRFMNHKGGRLDEPDADITTNYAVNVHMRQTPQGCVNLLIPRPPELPSEPGDIE